MDNHGQSAGESWPTLTEAAARTGYSREALRLRVRRGKLRAVKGNDGVTRLDPNGLTDLPPPDLTPDDPGRPEDAGQEATADDLADVLQATLADLRDDLGRTRSALEIAVNDRLVDRGRAERAEATAQAETARAAALELRLAATEAALTEARTPWVVRVVNGLFRSG